MENKKVGWLVIGLTIFVGLIVLIFNISLKNLSQMNCSHGPSCAMYDTIKAQLWLSLFIVGIMLSIGIFLLFAKPQEKVVIKKVKERKKKIDLSKLEKDEKELIQLLLKSGKAMFQSELTEKLEIGKVKMTRLLDKLEAKQYIIRKRRGMNNIVVIKD